MTNTLAREIAEAIHDGCFVQGTLLDAMTKVIAAKIAPLVEDAERMANELDHLNRSDVVILEIETVRKYRSDQ